jgi:hypothetical protein
MNPRHECNVVELRQYRLHAGQRDTLIELFDREFIDTQEALGMRVIGQFRDLDDDDRFVWLRGFANMVARRHGLQAFYGGPVWAAHRSAANAKMIDSDNVLLLRPAWPGAAQSLLPGSRATSAVGMPPGLIDVTIFRLREAADAELLACCRDLMSTTLARGGALRQGWYVTEASVNDFPRLPVREGEPVLVGVSVFADGHSFEAFQRSGVWARSVAPRLSPWLASPAESHRLLPTARSALHA